MKFLPLFALGSAILMGGCASTENASQTAAAPAGDSYVALGSIIPKKNGKRTEDQTVNMQQLENDRVMNNGVMNGPGSR
jgi:hypothetical protein